MIVDEIATATSLGRELDSRTSDGVTVTLWWRASDDTLTLEVWDDRNTVLSFSKAIAIPGDALFAFHHPFAWLAEQSIEDDG